jgi:hypothetical protein
MIQLYTRVHASILAAFIAAAIVIAGAASVFAFASPTPSSNNSTSLASAAASKAAFMRVGAVNATCGLDVRADFTAGQASNEPTDGTTVVTFPPRQVISTPESRAADTAAIFTAKVVSAAPFYMHDNRGFGTGVMQHMALTVQVLKAYYGLDATQQTSLALFYYPAQDGAPYGDFNLEVGAEYLFFAQSQRAEIASDIANQFVNSELFTGADYTLDDPWNNLLPVKGNTVQTSSAYKAYCKPLSGNTYDVQKLANAIIELKSNL